MAQLIIHPFVDDLDGTVLKAGKGRTVTPAIDGREYEIDLNSAHTGELHAALAPFTTAARKMSTTTRAPQRSTTCDCDNIRAWARANGREIVDRGRIPLDIERAYSSR